MSVFSKVLGALKSLSIRNRKNKEEKLKKQTNFKENEQNHDQKRKDLIRVSNSFDPKKELDKKALEQKENKDLTKHEIKKSTSDSKNAKIKVTSLEEIIKNKNKNNGEKNLNKRTGNKPKPKVIETKESVADLNTKESATPNVSARLTVKNESKDNNINTDIDDINEELKQFTITKKEPASRTDSVSSEDSGFLDKEEEDKNDNKKVTIKLLPRGIDRDKQRPIVAPYSLPKNSQVSKINTRGYCGGTVCETIELTFPLPVFDSQPQAYDSPDQEQQLYVPPILTLESQTEELLNTKCLNAEDIFGMFEHLSSEVDAVLTEKTICNPTEHELMPPSNEARSIVGHSLMPLLTSQHSNIEETNCNPFIGHDSTSPSSNEANSVVGYAPMALVSSQQSNIETATCNPYSGYDLMSPPSNEARSVVDYSPMALQPIQHSNTEETICNHFIGHDLTPPSSIEARSVVNYSPMALLASQQSNIEKVTCNSYTGYDLTPPPSNEARSIVGYSPMRSPRYGDIYHSYNTNMYHTQIEEAVCIKSPPFDSGSSTYDDVSYPGYSATDNISNPEYSANENIPTSINMDVNCDESEKKSERSNCIGSSVKLIDYKKMQETHRNGFKELECCQKVVLGMDYIKEMSKSLDMTLRKNLSIQVAQMNFESERVLLGVLKKIILNLKPGDGEALHLLFFGFIVQRILSEKQHLLYESFGFDILEFATMYCPTYPALIRYFVECIRIAFEKDHPESNQRCIFPKLDSKGNSLASMCALSGDSHAMVLAELLRPGRALVDLTRANNDGYLPLHLACKQHRKDKPCLKIVHVLLEHGNADLTIGDNTGGDTPLHFAVTSSHCDIHLILTLLANVDQAKWFDLKTKKNRASVSPFSYATKCFKPSKKRIDSIDQSTKAEQLEILNFLERCRQKK